MNAAASNTRLRVLLIEDNPGDARLMREYLADPAGATFQLEHRPTLAAGLECLAQGGIDLVLLDLSLPDMTGIEVLRALRDAGGGHAHSLPVVLFSADDHQAIRDELIQLGATDFVSKNNPAGLLRVVSAHVRPTTSPRRTD